MNILIQFSQSEEVKATYFPYTLLENKISLTILIRLFTGQQQSLIELRPTQTGVIKKVQVRKTKKEYIFLKPLINSCSHIELKNRFI